MNDNRDWHYVWGEDGIRPGLGRLIGGSANAIFASAIGPRPVLAPDDGSGSGGGGGAVAGGGAPDGGGDGAAVGNDAPSLLAAAVAAPADGKPAEPGAPAGDEKPTDGDKAAGDKPEGEKSVEADTTPKDVDGNPLPEAYEIKAPDGVEIDKALLDKVAPRFKEAKMSPKQAQLAADVYSDIQKEQIEAHSKLVEGWAKSAKEDKEIGGAKFEENLGRAKVAFDTFADPETMQAIDTYGLGNHPGILRMFTRIGNAISEGGTVLAGGGAGRVSDAEALYPSMKR